MAKNRVDTELRADDKGSLKKLGAKAKDAGKGIKSFANNVHASDRRLKGASQQSSNSTKNFSKMAQTMEGGIVPIYATLAAQVFAVSAAFQFFQNSVDFKNLIKGQEAFGAITGVAYRTFTKDIQAATAGQIGFKEAASATAIGIAAGLSRDQLVEIGTAAKNVSLALGRDLTDAFNRLTRGITKAEPELLDELGIVLRLDPAIKAYADSIGKNANQLNQFEKSQAIANEVLGQAEMKFGKITKAMDPSAYALKQFQVSFGEVVQAFQVGVANVLTPLLSFLSENVLALAGALALFTKPILQSILPNFEAMGASAEKNFGRTQAAFLKAQGAQSLSTFAGDQVGGRKAAYKGITKMNKQIGRQVPGAMHGQMSKKQIDAEMKAMRRGTLLAGKENKKRRRQYYNHLKLMEQSLYTSKKKQQGIEVAHSTFLERENKRRLMMHAKYEQLKVQATRVAARGMQLAMSAVGILGMIGLLVGLGSAMINFFRNQSDDQKAFEEKIQSTAKSVAGLNVELAKMVEFRQDGLISKGTETSAQFGNMIKSAGSINVNRSKFADLEKGVGMNRGMDDMGFEAGTDVNSKAIRDAQRVIGIQEGKIAGFEQEFGRGYDDHVRTKIARAQELIDKNKEQVATLSQIVYKDEELEKINKGNIQTYKSLSENAVGPLKGLYAEYAKALGTAGGASQELIDSIDKEEQKFISMTDRVAKAGEVSKTFSQSLSGMGKSGLYQAQRSAVDDMIKTQQAIVDSQALGGGEVVQKDVDDLAALKSFQSQINTLVTNERKEQETAQQNIRKRLEFTKATNDEQKLALITTKNLSAEEKVTAATRERDMALIARSALDLKTATKEQIADADFAVTIAKEKLETAEEEEKVQKILTQLEADKLQMAINNTKLAGQQLQAQQKILDLQLQNAGFNALFGQTAFGKRAMEQQKIEENKVKLKEKQDQIATRLLNKELRQKGMSDQEITNDNIKTENMEKQEQLLGKQIVLQEYAATEIGKLHIGFAKSLEDMFMAIADGSKSAKEAFKDMALFMLKQMAQLAAQQLAMKAMFAMGLGGPIAMAKGGIIPAYGRGGIATEPTYLVGEGKHNEAVVPLPDGRSIPVDMKGGSGTNNVSISVNVDGSSTNSFDSEKGKALGKAMEVAVMEVIQREKRPGGVLGR